MPQYRISNTKLIHLPRNFYKDTIFVILTIQNKTNILLTFLVRCNTYVYKISRYSEFGFVIVSASSCHQVFSSDRSKSGKLVSPLYPAPYPQKTQCHYEFLARGRERVRLVFEDFSLQRISDNSFE